MTPRIPLELAQARTARDEAWKLYDEAIETEGKDMIAERFKVCEYKEARCNDLYNQWQAMGGTSDIETLTAVELASKLEIVPFPQCQELSLNLVQSTQRVNWPWSIEDEKAERVHPDQIWDFTPFPKNMPDIDMDKVDEIPF